MQKLSFLLFVLVLFLGSHPAYAWTGKVVKLPNARTLVVESNGSQRTVRLYALRTPDLNEPFGKEAYEFFVDYLEAKRVEVRPVRSGSKDALVFVSGEPESVNARLLSRGWAWIQDAYCERAVLCGRLNKVQSGAERAKRGIWSKIPEDTPPWRWLKEHR